MKRLKDGDFHGFGIDDIFDGPGFQFSPLPHIDDFAAHIAAPGPVVVPPVTPVLTELTPDELRMPDRASFTDIASSKSTTATMAIGSTFTSAIDTRSDVDWIKVTLTAGQTYAFEMLDKDAGGGTLSVGNILGVYNSAGKLIVGSGDGAVDVTGETVNFTATTSGTYFVSVAGNGIGTGSYTVTAAVKDAVAPTLSSVSPTDNSSSVSTTSDLTLTFSEKVHAGTGYLTLTGSDGDKIVVDMSDTNQVSYSGTNVTINPTADLHAGVTYTVTMDADAVRDYSNNAYTGLSDTTAFNFTTAGGTTTTPPTGTPTESTGRAWNVMIYMAGDNNLESYGISDLNELESVLGLPSNVTITVLFDRSAGYSTASGDWTDTRVGVVTYDGTNTTNTTFADGTSTWTSWGEKDTGAGQTLTDFINWSSSTYAADNYALVVWNHGGGIYGSAWDYSSSYDNLTNSELVNAVANSNVDKFDVIAFDACLMQLAEVSYGLSPYADYIVGSEDYVPGSGFDYDNLLLTFKNDSSVTGTELAQAMVTTYANAYKYYSGTQLSALDTSKMGELVSDMSAFVARALQLDTSGTDWSAIRTASTSAYEFGTTDGYNYVDLGDFMSRVASGVSDTNLKSWANEIVGDIKAMITANGGTDTGSTGLAIYMPTGSETVWSAYTGSNFGWAAATHWDNMLALL